LLFPQLGPQYYDEAHKDILARMETFYAESITINQSFWNEADCDHRFESGDQTLWNDLYGNLPANRRRQFNFNRIKRIINMISGHQRRNRKSTIVIPFENGDQETADQFTKVMMWVDRQSSMSETISEAFHGSLIAGMNLLQVWVDYRSDPISGNIRVDNCSYNSFLIDPYFRKQDLSDCNSIWKRTFLTKREILSLLPSKADEIMGMVGGDNGTGRDGKFQFMPESYNYGMKNLMTYDEYYYRDYRTQQMLVDTRTGEATEWKSTDKDALKAFLQQYPEITVIDNEVSTVRLAIVVQGKVMYDGPQPNGTDKYPFIPVFSYYEPAMPYFPWRIQGVVRGLRDPQFLYNRRKIIELDILESQITSGFIYKENALVNPKDVFLSGQGRGLALKEEAQMTDVQQIQAPQIPPSMIELSKIMGEEISQISGVNEELLGSSLDDKAGILSMLRQGAGLTTLQGLFDNLDHAQKLLGSLIIDLVQTNFTPGKIQNILEGEKPAPLFYNKAFGKYHAAVEEGFNTTTQKQMQFAQMLQLHEAGVPITPEDLLEAATLQNKNKIVENMQKRMQEQAQAQQAQAQAQIQLQAAQTELAQARSIADRGLGLERVSRVEENKALAIERRAAAEKDKDAAFLDLIRAIKELDGMDIDHISSLIALANTVKAQEEAHVQSRANNPTNGQEATGSANSVASQTPPQ
jgi:hypothetical protein